MNHQCQFDRMLPLKLQYNW